MMSILCIAKRKGKESPQKTMFIKLCFAMLIIVILLSYIYFKPKYVNLELIKVISDTNISINDREHFNSEFHWWFIDSNDNMDSKSSEKTMSPDINKSLLESYPSNFLEWGIDFDLLGIDFNKNNVILSFSREIKEMKFKRADWFPYHRISTVKTVMSKEYSAHTIYIYILPKYNVQEDLRAYTETHLEL